MRSAKNDCAAGEFDCSGRDGRDDGAGTTRDGADDDGAGTTRDDDDDGAGTTRDDDDDGAGNGAGDVGRAAHLTTSCAKKNIEPVPSLLCTVERCTPL